MPGTVKLVEGLHAHSPRQPSPNPTEAMPLVTIRGLAKRFPKSRRPALDGIDADIRAGQVTGLVGPDGAGKTTLIRVIAGLLTASRGKWKSLVLTRPWRRRKFMSAAGTCRSGSASMRS